MAVDFSERVLEQSKVCDRLWEIINKLEPIHQMDRLALFHEIQPLFHKVADKAKEMIGHKESE